MKKYFFSLIIVSILVSSCSFNKLHIGQPERLEVEELSMQGVRLKVYIPIENPNNISFNVKNLNLDLILNDRNVGKIKKLKKTKILKNSKQTYPFSFEVTPKDALTNIIYLVSELQRRNPELKIDGSVTVSKMLISKKIKIDHKESFDKYYKK